MAKSQLGGRGALNSVVVVPQEGSWVDGPLEDVWAIVIEIHESDTVVPEWAGLCEEAPQDRIVNFLVPAKDGTGNRHGVVMSI
jgi:hypothetical protein